MPKEIIDGSNVLARHIPADEAWGDGLSFFSSDNEYVQVGSWGYDAGKELLAHAHNIVERTVTVTQEVLFIKKGSVLAEIYDSSSTKVAEFKALEGDIVILLGGGHGYKILEDGTQVLEIKNGPYLGADIDRVRL
jgi:hypothetical protein